MMFSPERKSEVTPVEMKEYQFNHSLPTRYSIMLAIVGCIRYGGIVVTGQLWMTGTMISYWNSGMKQPGNGVKFYGGQI